MVIAMDSKFTNEKDLIHERTSHRVLFCADRTHNLIVFLQSGTFMLIVHEKKAILKSRCRLPIRQIVLIDSDINVAKTEHVHPLGAV